MCAHAGVKLAANSAGRTDSPRTNVGMCAGSSVEHRAEGSCSCASAVLPGQPDMQSLMDLSARAQLEVIQSVGRELPIRGNRQVE